MLPSFGFADDLDSLVEKAKAEGQVTLYTSIVENVARDIADAFQEKYGITVNWVRLSSSPMIQRYSTEADAGNIVADLVFVAGGSRRLVEPGMANGWLQPVAEANLPVVTSGAFPEHLMFENTALIQSAPFTIVYNTDRITKDKVPTSFEGLLDEQFRGQILLPDPSTSDVYISFFAKILETYGEDFFKRLNELEPRRYPGGIPAVQALGAGEGTFMFPLYAAAVTSIKDQGAPIDFVIPEMTSDVIIEVALTAPDKSTSPNAARLLANFVMSEEGNAIVNSQPGDFTIYDAEKMSADYEPPISDLDKYRSVIPGLLGY